MLRFVLGKLLLVPTITRNVHIVYLSYTNVFLDMIISLNFKLWFKGSHPFLITQQMIRMASLRLTVNPVSQFLPVILLSVSLF